MNPLSPAPDVKIAPAHILSSTHFTDYLRVLAWGLWSPRTFIRYVEWLLCSNKGETPFPVTLEWKLARDWLRKNPHQRALLTIAGILGIVLLLGLVFVNVIFVAPLLSWNVVQARSRFVLFFVLFFISWAVMLTAFSLLATGQQNMGYLLIAALTGGIALAALVLFTWAFPFVGVYLAADSVLRAAVFLLWGYCLGYWFNIGFGYWRVEFVQLKTFVFLYATMCVAICWFLLAISGVTLTTISAVLQAEHWRAWHAAWWCCFGLLNGLLRPLEYLLLQFRPSPGVNERARGRAWAPPGLTLLPAYRMRDALGNWLDVDRDEGVHIVSQLSMASRQQQPLITPLQGQLAVCETDEMLGLGFEICDSGAVCATDVFKPPLVRNFKAPAIRGKGQDRRIYEHEVALAKAINAPKTPPEFSLEGDANTINAMLWYYNQGYLYKAAKVWRHAGGKDGAIAVSSPRIAELGALIDAFESLVDLEAASTTANFKLLQHPAPQFRAEAWELLTQLTTATRWVWRARHCGGAARNSCRDRFVADVERIAQQAQSKPLAERNLIRSITKHWQTQIKKLLRDGKVQPGFDPVHIRPWMAMHGELGELDPWSKFCAELHWRWQSGYTVVTLVDGLPKAQTGQAVAAAVDSLPATVQAMCDLAHLPDDPFVPKLLFNLCQEVAAKLQLPDPMPVGLASLSSPMIRDEMIRLCAQTPTTHVVVYIKNARRLVNGDVPTNIAQLALQELGELERRIHNLALTLETGSGKEVIGPLRSRVTSAGLRADIIYLPLLEWSGVQQWLDLQFGAAGLYCDDRAVTEIYRLTGGHPYLLEHLGACIAANYNNHFRFTTPCPLIEVQTVERAAASTLYGAPLSDFCKAAVRRYGCDAQRRLLLDVLAEINCRQQRAASAAEIAARSTANIKLPEIYVQETLDHWSQVKLVEEVPGRLTYRLRSLSLAKWIKP